MLGAIFTGLSGMNAYSRGLDVISNNVANLNTPGFKVSVPVFTDLAYLNGATQTGGGVLGAATGAGVSVDATRQSFRQGDLRDTGNPLDVAIDGSGFFILDRDGQLAFTRAGQFEFDKDGVLVDRSSQAKVMVSTEAQALANFDLDPYRVFTPKATTEVSISGNLARTGSTDPYELGAIPVIDTSGARQSLRAKFVRDATDPLKWTAEILDTAGTVLGSGTVTFNADGTLATDGGGIRATVKPNNLPEFALTVKFGTPGSFSGATSFVNSASSSLQVQRQDGLESGTLNSVAFDEKGKLKLTYSNGENKLVAQLLLAQFNSPDLLKPVGNGLFVSVGEQQPSQGGALTEGRGRIVGGRLELSNVELTDQFTDLIIIQRGYQASSQMTSVANEMLQQLLQMSNGR